MDTKRTVCPKVFINKLFNHFTDIFVRFFGGAENKWADAVKIPESKGDGDGEGDGDELQYPPHDYYARETFFDYSLTVAGDNLHMAKIPAGDNVFPFTFTVPNQHLPPSCELKDGRVFYGLEGQLIRKTVFHMVTEVRPINISSPVDLNATPGADLPVEMADKEPFSNGFSCWCCRRKDVCVIKTYSPKLGYCVGEVIPFIVEINNQTDKPILDITAELTMLWTFYAHGDRDRLDRGESVHLVTLQHESYPSVGPRQLVKWEVTFTIPSDSDLHHSTTPEASDIVKLEYAIMVRNN